MRLLLDRGAQVRISFLLDFLRMKGQSTSKMLQEDKTETVMIELLMLKKEQAL